MDAALFDIDTALLTNRCVVRRFREGEGKHLYRLISDNQDYLTDHFPILVAEAGANPNAAEAFVRERIANWLLQQDYAFGVWLNETTELVGYVHLFDINWSVPAAEISFFIDHQQVRKGLMTEVLARVVRFGFKQLALEKIYLRTLSDNFPSQRLARRVGFSREGDLRNEFRRPGGMLADLVRFGFSRETYGE
ncbi:GNAT family protein [Neolewinella lacunae]|uniref:GNAT family N-acetyltransferase n=1 Tax=Neolewinella lacunae TaxID=1517758 RepID=A0A923PF31_9BACT|nr:GNAT family protein [Neolewinella lacunae]MBC6992910.1 GNAT family N-acetyltransferase [Neolewinella lacunae]MDN3633726.1 GNAT family protein [Neolewinella lacunae]